MDAAQFFFGSVNEVNFLTDPTGNRRFWVIECEKINNQHEIDMQQVWAEIAELYKRGEKWYLTSDEIDCLTSYNESFKAIDPIAERIRCHYNWKVDFSDPKNVKWLTASDVCMEIGVREPTNKQARAAGTELRKIAKITKLEPKEFRGCPLFAVPCENEFQ